MYVAGGLTTDGTRLSSVESYDLPNNAWFPCAPLREARSSAMAFSVGSKFFVVGGENGRSADKDDGVLRTMEVYDEDLGSPHFQYGVSMPSPRCAASFGVIDGKFIGAIIIRVANEALCQRDQRWRRRHLITRRWN